MYLFTQHRDPNPNPTHSPDPYLTHRCGIPYVANPRCEVWWVVQFDPKFQVEGGVPHQPFYVSEKLHEFIFHVV